MTQNSAGQNTAESAENVKSTQQDAAAAEANVATTTTVPTSVVPEDVANHPRYSAWCFAYQMKFDRQPFTTPELTEQDKSDFALWVELDSKASSVLEEAFKKALAHPLWKEYCVHAINEGAEGQLYNGGGLNDVEDVEAEIEAWNDFLKNKENQQDKSQMDDAATDMASAVASRPDEPSLCSKDSQMPSQPTSTPEVPCAPTLVS